MTDNYIRPFSVAWYLNMQKQGQNITEDSLTGFPELVATAGLEDYDQTKAYPRNSLAYKDGSLFRANENIPANTPFAEGNSGQTWTNVTEAKTLIPNHDATVTYFKNQPTFYNGMIYRAKSDNLSGPFARAQWERISQPPMRQFLENGDPDTVLTQAYKMQEIIFMEDRVINGIQFNTGDRVLVKKDLNGTFVTDDLYYFPYAQAEQPQPPVGATDTVLTGTAGNDVDFFFVINPDTLIELDVDITDKITWTKTGGTFAGNGEITKIVYNNELMGSSQVLVKDTDYTIDGADPAKFKLVSIGLEPGDTLVVTFDNA